jgi:hypothetical protein
MTKQLETKQVNVSVRIVREHMLKDSQSKEVEDVCQDNARILTIDCQQQSIENVCKDSERTLAGRKLLAK